VIWAMTESTSRRHRRQRAIDWRCTCRVFLVASLVACSGESAAIEGAARDAEVDIASDSESSSDASEVTTSTDAPAVPPDDVSDSAEIERGLDVTTEPLSLEITNDCGGDPGTIDFDRAPGGKGVCTYVIWNRSAAKVTAMHLCVSGGEFSYVADVATSQNPRASLKVDLKCESQGFVTLAQDRGLRFRLTRTSDAPIVDGELSVTIILPEERVVRAAVIGQ
jgi:hypothetical protein